MRTFFAVPAGLFSRTGPADDLANSVKETLAAVILPFLWLGLWGAVFLVSAVIIIVVGGLSYYAIVAAVRLLAS